MSHPNCSPDLTLIFVIDLAVAAARVQGRGAEDKFEAAPQSFARNVQAAYRDIAAAEPQRCALIDGGQSLDAVRSDVLATLQAKFGATIGAKCDVYV
jgi:dTMP kinase